MAKLEHLNILEQGVDVWNKWREDNPDVKPDLVQASLEDINLTGIDFKLANLTLADLSGTKLYRTDFRGAYLFFTYLRDANITGSYLWGAARDNWIIDGIQCDYIYFDLEGKERIPKDRDFKPCEFEELHRTLPTFEYYFERGFTPIDAIIMDKVVQAINERHPEFELRLDSFHSRGQPHAKFTVLHKEVADQALQQITIAYGEKIKYLEGQRDQANALLSQFMTKLIEQPKIMTGDIKGPVCFNPTGSITQNLEIASAQDQGQATINKTASGNIINIVDIQDFTDNLKKYIDELGLKPDKRDELKTAVQSVEKEIQSPSPDAPKVNEYVATIRNILDGVAGSVIATGLLQTAQNLLR